jgi:hypothetical protein
VKKVFSVSGGGDPLNNVEEHSKFWDVLNFLSDARGIKYDIHTSYDNVNFNRFTRLNKVVYHITDPKRIVLPDWTAYVRTRVVLVIDSNVTLSALENLENQKPLQLSYRELVTDDVNMKPNSVVLAHAKKVGQRMKGGMFINQKDYNTYLFPDGSIKRKFLA